MKFPCLVSHAGLLSIALASHVHVPLEGDTKGMLQIADKIYEKPGYTIGLYCQPESVSFLQKATRNSNEHFKPCTDDFISDHREINIKDIDLTVFMSKDSVTQTNSINTIAAHVFSTLAAQTINEFKDTTPEVSDMVIVRHNEVPVKHTGELLFISEQYFIVRIDDIHEQHFYPGSWSIEKTPVEPTPHDLLKQAWFEQGQDVDDFIDYIVNEYGVVK